jgi:hypothetical protein
VAITIGPATTGQVGGGVATVTTSSIATVSGSVVVAAAIWDTVSFSSITDTYTNTWNLVGSEFTFDTSNSGKGRVYYAKDITGGAGHTFTVKTSATTSITDLAFELIGTSTAGTLDTSVFGSVTSGSTYSASITPSAGNRTLVALLYQNGTTTPTISGWTIPSGGNVNGSSSTWGATVAYQQVVANGSTSYTATFSVSGASSGLVAILSFIPAVPVSGSIGQFDIQMQLLGWF